MTEAVLALDPATIRLGWAIANLDTGDPLECGSHNVKGLGRAVRDALRAVHQAATAIGVDVTLIYVEAPGGGPNPLSTIKVAEAAGQVIQACTRRWPDAPIGRLAPAEWKRILDIGGGADQAAYTTRARNLGWAVPLVGVRVLRDDWDAAAAACIASAAVTRNQEILEDAA